MLINYHVLLPTIALRGPIIITGCARYRIQHMHRIIVAPGGPGVTVAYTTDFIPMALIAIRGPCIVIDYCYNLSYS